MNVNSNEIDAKFIELARHNPIVYAAVRDMLGLGEVASLKLACLLLNDAWNELYERWSEAHRLCPRRYAAGNQEVRWDAPDDWVPVERFPGEVVHGGIPRPDA